jgi:hypothetical protein
MQGQHTRFYRGYFSHFDWRSPHAALAEIALAYVPRSDSNHESYKKETQAVKVSISSFLSEFKYLLPFLHF